MQPKDIFDEKAAWSR